MDKNTFQKWSEIKNLNLKSQEHKTILIYLQIIW